jgi:hypothetical protein
MLIELCCFSSLALDLLFFFFVLWFDLLLLFFFSCHNLWFLGRRDDVCLKEAEEGVVAERMHNNKHRRKCRVALGKQVSLHQTAHDRNTSLHKSRSAIGVETFKQLESALKFFRALRCRVKEETAVLVLRELGKQIRKTLIT